MADRSPLVLGDDGLPQVLQAGDTLAGTTGKEVFTLQAADPIPVVSYSAIAFIELAAFPGLQIMKISKDY